MVGEKQYAISLNSAKEYLKSSLRGSVDDIAIETIDWSKYLEYELRMVLVGQAYRREYGDITREFLEDLRLASDVREEIISTFIDLVNDSIITVLPKINRDVNYEYSKMGQSDFIIYDIPTSLADRIKSLESRISFLEKANAIQ